MGEGTSMELSVVEKYHGNMKTLIADRLDSKSASGVVVGVATNLPTAINKGTRREMMGCVCVHRLLTSDSDVPLRDPKADRTVEWASDRAPNFSPMSRQARALHILRASSHPGRLRFADIAHLDQTISTMRRLVPPVNSVAVPEKINTVEDLETLLTDTIHLFKRLIEDPELVTALRARLASKAVSTSTAAPVPAPHQTVPSVQTEVDNLFTLLKLKRRSKKRIIPMRI
ncbi:unnamed protein product [Hydatigera taeniaeformis]|uniref:NPH3 domain-containing protein n=1 Tax=Hydatigena taeniaeformis TaxID=6205 RepID=A0A0R3X8Y9_HYDTA|nr:unnamed protein product [Hydatigera taeniaeformis]